MAYRVGVIGDIHIPFHDPKALSLILNVFKDSKVDEIVLNGDILDFYNVNSHGAKHPDIQETLESELNAGREFLTALRKMFPDQKITMIEGNHSYRLDRFIMDKCPAFWNIVKLEAQLNLEKLRIDYVRYNSWYALNSKLRVQHSPPSYGVNGARTSLIRKMDMSYIYGCTHRVQHATTTGSSGEVYHCYFNGWLGSTDLTDQHKKVFSYAKGHENWQKSGMIVDIFDDINFKVHPIMLDSYITSFGDYAYDFRKR